MNGFVAGVLTGALSLGTVVFSPGFDLHQQRAGSPASAPEKVQSSFHLDIFLRDAIGRRENVDSREVQLVRDCLYPVLNRVSDPDDAARAVRAVVGASFQSRVTNEETNVSYKAKWDEELKKFVVICCESSALEIDVNGVVVRVPMAIGTVLD